MNQLLKAFVATALLSSACSSPVPSASETKIIGGTPVAPGEWSNVVAITEKQSLGFPFFDITPEMFELIKSETLPKIICTGTAITPTLIVTAAHCLVSLTSLPDGPTVLNVHAGEGIEGGKFDVVFDKNSPTEGLNLGDLKTIATKGVHPDYFTKKGNGGFDLAFIVLKTSLDLPPSAYVPLAAPGAELNALVVPGRSLQAVGFGDRSAESGNNVATGIKHEVTLTVHDALPEVGAKDESGRDLHTPWNVETEIVAKDTDKGSCRGDSGGPVFGKTDNGEWRFVGVVSRAYYNNTCKGFATIYGLVSKQMCWLQKASKEDLGLTAADCDEVVLEAK